MRKLNRAPSVNEVKAMLNEASKRYTGKTLYCKHCGGILTMHYQDYAKWVPVKHEPFDCIDELAWNAGANIPPDAV